MLHYQIILLICPSFLLRKSILSPKCIIPVLQSLSPGVNIRLYHHSTETETHIYFIPQMAKSFDLLGFSRQKADCFHVYCMTKLIYSYRFYHFIPSCLNHFQISRKTCYFTRNIYNFIYAII